jgi:hypothetical protein
MPDMPQPTPKSAAPVTSGASIFLNSGSWKLTSNSGAARRLPRRSAANMTAMAGTMTKARLGSQPPAGIAVKSRKRRTLSGLTMPET